MGNGTGNNLIFVLEKLGRGIKRCRTTGAVGIYAYKTCARAWAEQGTQMMAGTMKRVQQAIQQSGELGEVAIEVVTVIETLMGNAAGGGHTEDLEQEAQAAQNGLIVGDKAV